MTCSSPSARVSKRHFGGACRRTTSQCGVPAADRSKRIHGPFFLDGAPPYVINPDVLLRQSLRQLPSGLRPASAHFEMDLLSREACLLLLHTFWYTYCAKLQDDSQVEQAAMLRLMSQVGHPLSWHACAPSV
jgi:hypothetical protein